MPDPDTSPSCPAWERAIWRWAAAKSGQTTAATPGEESRDGIPLVCSVSFSSSGDSFRPGRERQREQLIGWLTLNVRGSNSRLLVHLTSNYYHATKLNAEHSDDNPSDFYYKSNKKDQTIVIRLRSKHNRLKPHMVKTFRLSTEPKVPMTKQTTSKLQHTSSSLSRNELQDWPTTMTDLLLAGARAVVWWCPAAPGRTVSAPRPPGRETRETGCPWGIPLYLVAVLGRHNTEGL